MIKTLLEKIGLSSKETAVYLALLEKGKASASTLSKATDINRTTVYSVSRELIKKGIISQDRGTKNGYLVALPPEDLHKYIQAQRRAISKKENLVEKAIEELRALPLSQDYSIPRVRFVDGVEIEDFLYKQAPIWFKSGLAHGNVMWGFQDHSLLEAFPEWVDFYWKRAPDGHQLNFLANTQEQELPIKEKRIEGRSPKYIDKNHDFTTTQGVIGDYYFLIMTHQKPYYMVQIHDPVVAHNMREAFRLLYTYA